MIAAGIDIGAKTVKVVLTDQGRILARSLVPAGMDTAAATQTFVGGVDNGVHVLLGDVTDVA